VKDNLNRYRPDIDGLRAIAVLAVVLYHFDVFNSLTKAGYIGVDIFFVISGYLITQILYSDLHSERWLARFYLRRVRRIFPALLLVMFAVLIVASLVMLPYEFKKFGREVIGGSSFSSNIVYFLQSGYFDQSSQQKPLLHLWSLGIEEQFYLFWPILIWSISKLRWNLLISLSMFTAGSFAYCQLLASNNQELSFYSPISRAWELGLGGLLAIYNHSKLRADQKYLANLGIVVLILSFFVVDNQNSWPNIYTILPVLGTILILSNSSSVSMTSRILSNRILVYIGRISYPLYLWHWPLYVFFYLFKGYGPNRSEKLFLFVVAFSLASLTYHYIEMPIRKSKALVFWARNLSIAMSVILVSGVILAMSSGFPQRVSSQMSLELSQRISTQLTPPQFQNEECLESFPNTKAKNYGWWFCRTNSLKPPTTLLWGNSFANQYFEGFADNNSLGDSSILSIGDCAIQREIELEKGNPCAGRLWEEQRGFVEKLIINTPSLKFVIVAGLEERLSESGATDLRRSLNFLANRSLQPIVFYPHLKPDKPIFACLDRPLVKATWDCKVSSSMRSDLNVAFSSTLDLISREFPTALIFDPNEAICDSDKCEFMRDGLPLLRDKAGHMSFAGSRIVAEQFQDWARDNLNTYQSER
jgi:peptidoglycan/LPS O-acetylase OafA/YrhL